MVFHIFGGLMLFTLFWVIVIGVSDLCDRRSAEKWQHQQLKNARREWEQRIKDEKNKQARELLLKKYEIAAQRLTDNPISRKERAIILTAFLASLFGIPLAIVLILGS